MRLNKIFILFLFISVSVSFLKADNEIKSYFGFTSNMPEDWFVFSPDKVKKYNENETIESLGLSTSADRKKLEEILTRVKSGNIEFYYDRKYLNDEIKNNVTVQLSEPIVFHSIEELKNGMDKECKRLPESLKNTFKEEVKINMCKATIFNGHAILHHSYVVPSQNVFIINEQMPINGKYSILFVSGSNVKDINGVKRVREAQNQLIIGFTKYLNSQIKPK